MRAALFPGVALVALALLWALLASDARAQTTGVVEINLANQAQLEQLRGIGPPMAERILAARQAQPFRDWRDVIDRVRGVREATAARLSDAGLRVNGQPFESAAAPRAGGASAPEAGGPPR